MRMNDAEKQKIKATPTKIINLQLFVNVFITFFIDKTVKIKYYLKA